MKKLLSDFVLLQPSDPPSIAGNSGRPASGSNSAPADPSKSISDGVSIGVTQPRPNQTVGGGAAGGGGAGSSEGSNDTPQKIADDAVDATFKAVNADLEAKKARDEVENAKSEDPKDEKKITDAEKRAKEKEESAKKLLDDTNKILNEAEKKIKGLVHTGVKEVDEIIDACKALISLKADIKVAGKTQFEIWKQGLADYRQFKKDHPDKSLSSFAVGKHPGILGLPAFISECYRELFPKDDSKTTPNGELEQTEAADNAAPNAGPQAEGADNESVTTEPGVAPHEAHLAQGFEAARQGTEDDVQRQGVDEDEVSVDWIEIDELNESSYDNQDQLLDQSPSSPGARSQSAPVNGAGKFSP